MHAREKLLLAGIHRAILLVGSLEILPNSLLGLLRWVRLVRSNKAIRVALCLGL